MACPAAKPSGSLSLSLSWTAPALDTAARWRRTPVLYQRLAGLGVPKDIVWWTPEEIEECAASAPTSSPRRCGRGECSMKSPHEYAVGLRKRAELAPAKELHELARRILSTGPSPAEPLSPE